MKKRLWINLAFCFVVPVMMFTFACAKKMVPAEPAAEQISDDSAGQQVEEIVESIEEGSIDEYSAAAAEEQAAMEKAARELFVSENIYFEFDSSVLLQSAQDILKVKGVWMLEHPGVSVIIEGHCDERGTNDYNIALGERRAESAKSFLIDLGIAYERLTTVSYGEEQPLDPAHNQAAWAKNRRAHFMLE